MSRLWEFYGSNDPYYGVLSADEFRAGRLDAAAKARFFESGLTDVMDCIEAAERTFGPLSFDTALDYGCGVGRLSRHLATKFKHVISVDISAGMLNAARENLRGLNVSFENASEMSERPASFIMSQMVFQHIRPADGLKVIPQLAARLDGSAVIEMPIEHKAGVARRMLRLARRTLKAVVPIGEPIIPMYVYDVRAVTRILERAGCRVSVTTFDTPMFVNARVAFNRGK